MDKTVVRSGAESMQTTESTLPSVSGDELLGDFLLGPVRPVKNVSGRGEDNFSQGTV